MYVRPRDFSSSTYCNGILEASLLYEPPVLTALFALHLVIFLNSLCTKLKKTAELVYKMNVLI